MKKLELISWRNLCNNIKFAIDGTPLIQTIINSFFVSTVASLIGLLVALLGAYYYVYQNAHHSKIWFYLTICAMYIPEATLLISIAEEVAYMATAKKLPSGKYRCRASYTDEYGNYKTKSFTAETKKEAENLASNFIMEREHKAKPENKTLGELADAFLESKSEVLSPSTLRGYKSIRNNAFKSIIDVRLGILTKELYQKAVNEYAKGRSPKTVLSAHVFFNTLLKENDIFVGEKATLPRKAKKETEIPTTVEVKSFLQAIQGTRLYLYCLFSVCLGLRKSETIALQWKDIDLDKNSVSINKARVRDDFGEYVIKQTKTFDGTRTLHLPPVLISALGEAGDPDEYIITDSPKALESLYQREKTRLGFNYNFHALRHYYASVMLINGVPNRYARERMGHATEDMLIKVYQHTMDSKQKEYDSVLDDFFAETLTIETE